MFRNLILGLIFLFPVAHGIGEQLKALEFSNKDFKDILLTFGQMNGISIIPDETVEGRATYYFADMDSEQALRVFIENFNLQYTKINGVYYVSKVKVLYDKTSGKLTIKAVDSPLRSIVKSLVAGIGKTILYDSLPNENISISLEDGKVEDALKILIAKYPDYVLDKQDSFFYIRRKSQDPNAPRVGERSKYIQRSGELFSVSAEKARFRELVIDLFSQGKREFLLLLDRDQIIENLFVSGKTFDELLKIILLQGNADFTISENLTVIYEVQRKDLMKRYLATQIIALEYISSADFMKLLPPSLGGGSQMRIDEKGNKIILSGSPEELAPLLNFIRLIDKPLGVNKPVKIDLDYLKAEEAIGLLPTEFSSFLPQAVPGKGSFLIAIPEKKRLELEKFIAGIDKPANSFAIRLKYIKADDLLAALPPTVTEASFAKTKDPSLVFFKGTEAARMTFMKDLAIIDVPKPQIRYDIMVIQVRDDRGLDLSFSPSINPSNDQKNFAVQFGFDKVWNIKMDLIGYFGYTYGINLTANLKNEFGNVLADTTLTGLSGEKISFQNTGTYRYMEYPYDSATGTSAKVGVLRELASGLILNVEGWTSGDNMITMKVDATLSKQQSATSTNTTENKVNTNVRTSNGSPIVIGGLKREEKTLEITKIPILGDIPLLGFLFQSIKEGSTNSEFIIYIVPHVEMVDKDENWLQERLFKNYNRMVSVF